MCFSAGAGLVLLALAWSTSPALADTPAASSPPPLGRGHLLFEAGGIDIDDAAAREWGVNREGFFALAGYRGDARGAAYLGGEIGHAGTDEATNSDQDRIEDFDLWWIEVNGKRAFALGRGWSADVGFGGSFFYVDGQEVTFEGGEEFRDPLADVGFGLQGVGNVSWRFRRLLLGINVHYQWAFDLIDVDYSNLRVGVHLGVVF
jgi:hypothetical protein